MQGLHKNTGVQNQVKELTQSAKAKNIQTIAERVQDANTMAVLWQLGVSYIQGNYVQNTEIVIEDTSQSSITTLAMELSEDQIQETSTELWRVSHYECKTHFGPLASTKNETLIVYRQAQ